MRALKAHAHHNPNKSAALSSSGHAAHGAKRRGGGAGGNNGRASDERASSAIGSHVGSTVTLEEKVKRLDGGLEMLRSGKTAEEVLQAYSRHALVKALAEMRAKTLQEPRKCGVREGATWCVGEWCARADASAREVVGSRAWRLDVL